MSKDCINSLKFIEEDGIILFHDFLPQNYLQERVPRKSASWTGDVWKVAVELTYSEGMDFRIANIDYGVGILKPGKNAKYKKMPELNKMNFDDFLNKFYKNLPKINSEEAIEFIEKVKPKILIDLRFSILILRIEKDRLKFIKKQLKKNNLKAHRVEGIEPRRLDKKIINRNKKYLTPSGIALCLVHKNIWINIVKKY